MVETVVAEFKYNSVFLTTPKDRELLAENGYGAKLFKPVKEYIPPTVAAVRGDAKEGPKDAKISEDNEVIETKEEDEGPTMLFDEEAYYLHRMGHISIRTKDGAPVDSLTLWTKFIEKNSGFPLKYKVYDYFRSKGFVVKTGVHFGLDYSVYRTLPSLCHSEMCAIVVDATQPRTAGDIAQGRVTSSGQVGWRHLSTLTRVMPDVMKLLVMCYVIPNQQQQQQQDRVDFLFGVHNDRHQQQLQAMDMSTPAFIDATEVRPVTSLVRRLAVAGIKYMTIGDIQAKYRGASMLKCARQKQTVRKKHKKRRDHTEIREKKQTKHKAHWKALMRPNDTERLQERAKKKRMEIEQSKAAEMTVVTGDADQDKSETGMLSGVWDLFNGGLFA